MGQLQGPGADAEAKLQVQYASQFYCTQLFAVSTDAADLATCDNCSADVLRVADSEPRKPLCPACHSMMLASIKRAASRGFRIG